MTGWIPHRRGACLRTGGPKPLDPHPSPVPDGLALLGERRRALLRVLRREHGAGDLALLVPELLVGPVARCRRISLVAASASGAFLRSRRELERGVDRLARLGEPVDEAELVAALGASGRRSARAPSRCRRARAAGGAAAPPPAATSAALDLRDAELARPRTATIRSQASAISKPPATAKPSTAAISGLRGARCVMPAKPRSPTYGRSPATNALRSMPAQKPLPAPVSTPTCRLVVGVERVERGRDALARARWLTELRASGRLSVMSRTPSRRSVRTA